MVTKKTLRFFSFFIIALFAISFASAWEPDNVISNYDEVHEVITFKNAFGLGDVIGQVQLKTPKDFHVAQGYNYVWELEAWVYGDYNDFLKGFEFEDMKNGKAKINRDIDVKMFMGMANESYDTYGCLENTTLVNETIICSEYGITGEAFIEVEVWTKVTPADIKKSDGVVRLRGYTDVQQGDKIDWSPLIFGVRVSHDIWAEWTQDLNVDLLAYYKLDETSGTAVEDSTGIQSDGTLSGVAIDQPGKIGKSFDWDTLSDIVDLNSPILPISSNADFTISTWIKTDSYAGGVQGTIFGQYTGGSGGRFIFTILESGGNHALNIFFDGTQANSGDTSTYIETGVWTHVLVRRSGGTITGWVNGTSSVTMSKTSSVENTNTRMGVADGLDSLQFSGNIDEVGVWDRALTDGEIAQLYNNYDGITWTDEFGIRPSVTLISPEDNANLTSSNVAFISTVTDDLQVSNVTLYIDGVLNETDTSGVNGTYTFNKIVSEGVHNWSILAVDNDSLSNQSETRTFNYTQPPIDIQLNNPSDAFVSNIPLVNMSCSAMDPIGVEQLNLTIDGVVNETLLNSSVAENLTLSKEIIFAEGVYIWGCQAINSVVSASSANRTLNVSYSLPVVTLDLPINKSNITTPTIDFTFNATDVNGIDNVSLYIDGIFDQINTSGIDGEYVFLQTFGEGLFNWSIVANSILGKQTISETRNFNVSFSSPVVILGSPGDGTNTTNETVTFDFTATDDNGIDNISLYINGILNETNTTGINGTYLITKTLTEGFYNWSVIANSILGKQTVSDVNSFIVHLTAPNATIIAPNGSLGYFLLGDNETLSYNFSEPGQNVSEHLEECWYTYYTEDTAFTNYTGNVGILLDGNISTKAVITNGSQLNVLQDIQEVTLISGNLAFPYLNQYSINISGCSSSGGEKTIVFESNIEIGNTWQAVSCDSSVLLNFTMGDFGDIARPAELVLTNASTPLNCSANSTEFLYQEGLNNISIYAIDTFGFIATDTSTWTYKLLEINTTYNAATVEGSTETFELSMNSSGTVISASLIYNGTAYSTSILSPGGGAYEISSTITIPDFPIDANATFYFQVTFTDSDVLNSSINSQFVSVLLIDDCSNYSNLLLNVSLFDEKTIEPLVGTIETDLTILDSIGTSTLSQVSTTFYSQSNFEVCSNINLSAGDFLYNLELRYYVDPNNDSNFLYVPEFYHIQKSPVSNFPQDVDLYDLNANDSTEFVITYQNDDFIFVEGAIVQLQRKYVGEGIYRVVEAPITSDGGKAIVHVDLNTNKYRATVVRDGVLLDSFEDIVFNCENELSGQCEEKLEGNVDPNNDVPLTEILDFVYSIATSEDDKTVTVSFTVPSGSPTIVNVLLDQFDMFGNVTTCNNTIVASAGSIICSYNDTIEKSILELQISKEDFNIATLSYSVDPELDMDGINFFIVFVFMISLVGMAIASPEWMMIISVMVLMISGTLLLVAGMNLVMGLGAIAWLVVAVGIIVLKMSKQEDR